MSKGKGSKKATKKAPAKPSLIRGFFVFITLILVYYRAKQENKSRLMTSKEI